MIVIIIKANLMLCYLPKAEADNTNWGLDNYCYHVKSESNNCFTVQIPELHLQRQECAQNGDQCTAVNLQENNFIVDKLTTFRAL